MSIIQSLFRTGIRNNQDSLLNQRIRLVNTVTLSIQAFALTLLLIVVFYGLFVQAIIGGLVIILLCLVYLFNDRGWPKTASLFLINFTCFGILVASYRAYDTSVFAETENWLFACLVITVFLFDRWGLIIQFLVIFVEICGAKFVKYQMFGLELGRDFNLLIINSIVLSLGIYLTLVIVKEGLRKALNRLQEEDKAKTKLMSLLAHDIKNPVSTFESLLEVNSMHGLTKEEFEEVQKGIQEKFQPIKESIHGLLDWSMSQLKGAEPVITSFALMELVHHVRKECEINSKEKNIQLVQSGDEMKVRMDREHLMIILRNVLHNAVKFSPRDAEIKLAWEKNGRYVNVSVEDSGSGLSQEQIDSILDGKIIKSQRGTDGEKGTGLGLNLSLELLRKNGGSLAIQSDDSLTRFTIQIPK